MLKLHSHYLRCILTSMSFRNEKITHLAGYFLAEKHICNLHVSSACVRKVSINITQACVLLRVAKKLRRKSTLYGIIGICYHVY